MSEKCYNTHTKLITQPALTKIVHTTMKLEKLVESGRAIRVMGIDDAHYDKNSAGMVNVAGVVCSDTRFEGLLWNTLTKDGLDATERIVEMVRQSKFAPQLHLVLLDGITFGGGNVVDLLRLHNELEVPFVAVMRRLPNLPRFESVLSRLSDPETRLRWLRNAGPIHELDDCVFQCQGESPEVIARVLNRLTDTGKMPEALRIAHLIGAAVMLGQSTKRA